LAARFSFSDEDAAVLPDSFRADLSPMVVLLREPW
jgi:hypothetical protein